MVPIHPGRILRRELNTQRLSANALARALRVPSGRIVDILNGKRSVTAETALRLGRYFGNAPHVLHDSVRPTCSGQTKLSAGFCRTLSMVTVERSGNGPLLNLMANLDHPASRANARSASAIASSVRAV